MGPNELDFKVLLQKLSNLSEVTEDYGQNQNYAKQNDQDCLKDWT